jgi:hypothetical protein
MHTPGPWNFGKLSREIFACGESEKAGKTICKINPPYDGFLPRWSDDPGENKANAALIAAAPELLEALKLLKSQIKEHIRFDVKKHYSLMVADAAADKAISKAEGKG